MRHVILISGKDSLATALIQRERAPGLHYEYIFNEVGWELPETFVWLNQVEAYLGEPLYHCGDDLNAIVDEENCLPLPQRRFCTRRGFAQASDCPACCRVPRPSKLAGLNLSLHFSGPSSTVG